MEDEMGKFIGCLLGFAFILANICAWFTHVFVCLKLGLWGYLIAGAILFPIAMIHGWGIWFGCFPS